MQLRLALALLGLEPLVALRGLGLALELLQLARDLITHVLQALQILSGIPDAALGLAPALLVNGDPGRFLQITPQILRTGLDEPRDRALLDNGVATRAQPRAQKDIGDIALTAARPVEVVVRLGVAGDLALDGDLAVGGVRAADAAVTVIEDELDRRLADRLARRRAIKDHVRHGLAAQVLRRALAHDPAHRVDDVGLAAAVGPDHGDHFPR